MKRHNLRAMAVACGAAGMASGAAAQVREFMSDPYMPPGPRRVSSPATQLWPRGLPRTAQVNVDPDGLNIEGDAANEPSLAINPLAPNSIAVGWRQFDTIQSNFRQAGVAYSRDGGRTWTNLPPLQAGVFRSDPVLGCDAEGRFWYNSLRTNPYRCWNFFSDDGGATWSEPADAFGGDKAWFCLDTTNGPGRGHFYSAWSGFGSCCGSNNTFTRSTDGGQTYLNPIPVVQRPHWGTMFVAADDGALFIGGNDSGNTSQFRMTRSSNARFAGESPAWDLTRIVSLGGQQGFGVQGSPNPGGLLGQVSIAEGRSVGPLRAPVYLLCSVDPQGPDPLDVVIARSMDGGETWSNPIKVNAEPGNANAWQWFGTLSVSTGGRLDVVYNDTLGTGSPSRSITKYTSSTDRGDTWSAPVAIGLEWDSWVGWPQQQKIGDYYDMKSDDLGANLIYATTYNGEEDVYFARIGPDDCNRNGQPDESDLASGASEDCNTNGIPDECDLAAGLLHDEDGDGRPDECCAADFNGDGFVTGADFDEYVIAFEAGQTSADFDGDGFVTGLDFDAFVLAFEAGC